MPKKTNLLQKLEWGEQFTRMLWERGRAKKNNTIGRAEKIPRIKKKTRG